MKTDFIIIGSGLAGLTSALTLKEFGEVLIISKSIITENATNLAQGGIAAVVAEDDSFENHIQDTFVSGAYHNNKQAVDYVVRNAPLAIEWLVAQGVRFDLKNSHFAATREAAHSHRRILHASDLTGKEIERALVSKVISDKNITVITDCMALDLLVEKGRCLGVQAIYKKKIINIFSRAVILATGGLGQIYHFTTNPKTATGDGLAMAYRAGGTLFDLEFIQFHPTALKHRESPLFLLSEALRGEGAYLIKLKTQSSKLKNTKGGERFMEEIDPRGELAPRDVVARAIFRQQQEGFGVFLDIRHKGAAFIRKRFPNISRELKTRGFDLSRDLIPVTPAAHYSCGGVKVDLYGRTKIRDLFAFGEVAWTGVHGANRLASNSLLEAVVFPQRLKKCISSVKDKVKEREFSLPILKTGLNIDTNFVCKLQKLMWEKIGIIRTRRGMKEALEEIKNWERELAGIHETNQELAQIKNMLLVAKLVTIAALKRKKSLGAHFVQ